MREGRYREMNEPNEIYLRQQLRAYYNQGKKDAFDARSKKLIDFEIEAGVQAILRRLGVRL